MNTTPDTKERLVGLALDDFASPQTRRAYAAALGETLTWSQDKQPSVQHIRLSAPMLYALARLPAKNRGRRLAVPVSKRLKVSLRDDLDTIVLKAIEKEPLARHSTADALRRTSKDT